MTDSEKIDLILSKLDKMDSIESEIQGMKLEMQDMKKDLNAVKRQVIKSTAELKAMDEMVLDEVERVHLILDKHKKDKSVHTA